MLVQNANMTKYIIFYNLVYLSSIQPDTVLKRDPVEKYLGIWVNREFTFEFHINKLVSKFKQKLDILHMM